MPSTIHNALPHTTIIIHDTHLAPPITTITNHHHHPQLLSMTHDHHSTP